MAEKRFNVRVPEELLEQFYRAADENCQTPSQLVRRWMTDYVRAYEERKKQEGE